MTEKQAIAHAKTFAIYWIIKSFRARIWQVRDHFPNTWEKITKIINLLDDVEDEVRNHNPENVIPWVKPRKVIK